MASLSPTTFVHQLRRLGIFGRVLVQRLTARHYGAAETRPAVQWALLVVGLAADTLHAMDSLVYHTLQPGKHGPTEPRKLLRWVLNKFNTFELVHLGRILRSRWEVHSVVSRGMLFQWAAPPRAHHGKREYKTVLSDAVREVYQASKRRGAASSTSASSASTTAEDNTTPLLPFGAPFPELNEPGAEYYISQDFLERTLNAY